MTVSNHETKPLPPIITGRLLMLNKHAQTSPRHRSGFAGFTLVEIIIVVAIVTILAAIAVPSYSHYITKTKRAQATACLSEYGNYMERFYATYLNYAHKVKEDGSKGDDLALPELSCSHDSKKDYTYTLDELSTSSYTLKAAPQGVQADRDTRCGSLTLDNQGTRGADDEVTSCWR